MSHPIQPQNWADRAIEAVAPSWAARRYAARARIEVARSMPAASYRGAVATRGSTPWGSSVSYRGGSSRDRRDLADMRDRARTIYRDNAIAKSLLNTETDNIVAEGFTLQMNSGDAAFDQEAEDRFYAWLDTADLTGKMTGSQLFRASWLEPRKDGDGGFVLAKRGGYPRLQYIPGDLIRNPYKGFDPRTMFDGVETDPAGRPVRFWVRDVDEAGKDIVTDFPVRDFVFIAHLDAPLACRGETVYGPIMELLDQIDSYRDSVTKAGIMAAIFGLVEKRKNPGAVVGAMGTLANSQGEQQKALTLENGMLKVLGTDESIFQVQANQPMQQTPDFLRALCRIAAIGFDMPIEVALRDLSQVNFSGGQLGMKGYERTCRVRQDWLRFHWNRIVFWWLSVERQRQQLGFPDAFKTRFPDATYGNFELHAREWLLRDRLGEAKADLMECSIGVSSPQKACAQRSVDYKEMQRQRAEAWKANDAEGLPNVLPTDTRDATPAPAPAAAADPEADQKAFERTVVSAFLADKTVNDVIYNVTDIPTLLQDVGLPLDRKVLTNPDQAIPYLPVIAEPGPLVSGDTVQDPQGDIVGGDVENEAPADTTHPTDEPKDSTQGSPPDDGQPANGATGNG